MKVRRRTLEQQVQRRYGIGSRQTLDFVKGQQARTAIAFDGADQQTCPVLRLRVGPVAGADVVVRLATLERRESHLFERKREIGHQRFGTILLVKGQPSDGGSRLTQSPTALDQQRRLAETAGCDEHRETAIQQLASVFQRRALHVSHNPVREQYPLTKQPRKVLPLRAACRRYFPLTVGCLAHVRCRPSARARCATHSLWLSRRRRTQFTSVARGSVPPKSI